MNPPCFHGLPYPGYFLGPLCKEIPLPTWLDLRALDDFDAKVLHKRSEKGIVHLIHQLGGDLLKAALSCVAAAEDTTQRQERNIRDLLAKLG